MILDKIYTTTDLHRVHVRAEGELMSRQVVIKELVLRGQVINAGVVRGLPMGDIIYDLRTLIYEEIGYPGWMEEIPPKGTTAFWDWAARVHKWAIQEERPPILTLAEVGKVHRDTAKSWARRMRQQGRISS